LELTPQAQKRPRFGTLTMRLSMSSTSSILRASVPPLQATCRCWSYLQNDLAVVGVMAAISALPVRRQGLREPSQFIGES
jgi:hypothetical protein